MADIIPVCGSSGLTVSEAKTETMCLMTTRMDRVTFVAEAAGEMYKQTTKFVYLGETVCKNANFPAEINRRVLLVKLRFRRYSLPTVRPTYRTALTRSADAQSRGNGDHAIRACHVEPHRGPSRRTADSSPPIAPPLHRMEEKTSRRLYHMLLYADALPKTDCEKVEMTVCKRRILFARLVARMGNERLPKRVMFGELEGGKGCLGGQEQD